MRTQGVIYVATGAKYLKEAIQSANSVQRVMPGLPMTLFTDQDVPSGTFDQVILVDGSGQGRPAKIRSMAASPYDETLFLDTDTWMCQPCYDAFWPLNKFDIAVAHEVYRNEYDFERFPDSFPALNTGVVVYRKSPQTDAFFQSWERAYLDVFRHKRPADQPAFRHTLYHSDLMHYILPPEFNFRTNYPVVLGGFARAKIIHDRCPSMHLLDDLLGHDTGHPPIYYGPVVPRFLATWCHIRIRTLFRRFRERGLLDSLRRLVYGKSSRKP